MTEEDEAFEELAKRQGDWGLQGSRKHQIMRYAENVENKGTSMTDKEVIKKMYQLLLTEPHAPTLCDQLESIAREALAQPEQEPVAWQFMNGSNFRKRRPDDFSDLASDGLPYWRPLYTTPPQRTEQNFCSRCGKRTPDLITIHTCTPPKD
jgi:hypothetical protein